MSSSGKRARCMQGDSCGELPWLEPGGAALDACPLSELPGPGTLGCLVRVQAACMPCWPAGRGQLGGGL